MKNFISSFLSKVKKKRPRDYILYSAVIAVGLFLDQLTKWLAEKYLAPLYPKSVVIINKVVSLTYAENTGAAFGSMKDARWIFMVTSTILIVVLSAYLYLGFAENKLYEISIAMIISGGIGNMIDRMFFTGVLPQNAGDKVVRDFIDFSDIGFPAIFNGADSFVCVGAGLLILALILDIVKEAKAEKAAKAAASDKDSDGEGEE
ncbi:MAG: signal peptidase II [Clostridia bacterium]|nr:signal peptidase II [Clostridia bacterium]